MLPPPPPRSGEIEKKILGPSTLDSQRSVVIRTYVVGERRPRVRALMSRNEDRIYYLSRVGASLRLAYVRSARVSGLKNNRPLPEMHARLFANLRAAATAHTRAYVRKERRICAPSRVYIIL